jgi:hypothetical protein
VMVALYNFGGVHQTLRVTSAIDPRSGTPTSVYLIEREIWAALSEACWAYCV